ncbi:hypothetical protein PFICI_04575 [Pestalotiopsis fici W106-1]|uniref:Uncharacterized protein n=1 Tax=Pestalotiopsis fici (strain W106-1 / CGMCC3.15140) TaxID=1229662 RepID=W3X9I5_PESFW|nr:uncharacterized protein PFICI_04575 [Pestalotiopsis fici W106-1]ETS82699.1 hypothetical protein PFICI_04575 [Pestalotiopsis fici W106-1]
MASQSSLNAHKQEMHPEPGLETMPKRFQDETSPRIRNLGTDQQQSQPEELGEPSAISANQGNPLLQTEIYNKDNPMALVMRGLSLNQQRKWQELPREKQNAFMDAMYVPGAAISQISSQIPQPPSTIKNWGELKQWLIRINANPSAQKRALELQQLFFLKLLSGNQAPTQNPGGDQLPPGVQPLDTEESNRNAALDNDLRNVTVVPEEIQHARLANQKFNGWNDEDVWRYLVQIKQHQIKKKYTPRPPQQQPTPDQADQSG